MALNLIPVKGALMKTIADTTHIHHQGVFGVADFKSDGTNYLSCISVFKKLSYDVIILKTWRSLVFVLPKKFEQKM